MGTRLLWTGLTLIVAVPEFGGSALPWKLVGAVIMVIGLVLMWLNR